MKTKTVYTSSKWHRVREEAIERDGSCCCDCGATEPLHVHHRRPVAAGGPAYVLENLVTLCAPCHRKRHRRMDERLQQQIESWESFLSMGGTDDRVSEKPIRRVS